MLYGMWKYFFFLLESRTFVFLTRNLEITHVYTILVYNTFDKPNK